LPPPPFNVSLPPAPIITLSLLSPVRVSLEDPPPIFKKLEALARSDERLKVIEEFIDSFVQHPDSPGVANTNVLDPEPPLILRYK
jgi:hypothetical protein